MKHILGYMLSGGVGAGIGAFKVKKEKDEKIKKKQEESQKHFKMFLLMNQWVNLRQNGKLVKDYFIHNNYCRIAIYGMSYIGETLLNELKNSGICVAYGIDSKADELYAEVEILKPEDELPEVDAVVVTAFYFYDEICEALEKKFKCPILSIKDILEAIE